MGPQFKVTFQPHEKPGIVSFTRKCDQSLHQGGLTSSIKKQDT